MPSGKKSKQLRRAATTRTPPPVVSKGGPRVRQADPRLLAAIGGVIALAAIGIVLAVVLGGGSKSSGIPKNYPTYGSLATGLPGASDVQAMYQGIPQKGLLLGSPFAPVRMVMYIDLQCPLCQQFETTTMTDIVPKYVRTGKVRVEVRPWAFIGPDSTRGQEAMFAAAKQNKAYNFAQILYDNQGTENTGWLDDGMVYQAAESVPGLNVPQLLSQRKAAEIKSEIDKVSAQVVADKVNGTPTVFIGKSGAKPTLVGQRGLVPTEAQVTQAISAALSG